LRGDLGELGFEGLDALGVERGVSGWGFGTVEGIVTGLLGGPGLVQEGSFAGGCALSHHMGAAKEFVSVCLVEVAASPEFSGPLDQG